MDVRVGAQHEAHDAGEVGAWWVMIGARGAPGAAEKAPRKAGRRSTGNAGEQRGEFSGLQNGGAPADEFAVIILEGRNGVRRFRRAAEQAAIERLYVGVG
jgi:hypothetical protein